MWLTLEYLSKNPDQKRVGLTGKTGVVSIKSGHGLKFSRALCVLCYTRIPLREILHPPLCFLEVPNV